MKAILLYILFKKCKVLDCTINARYIELDPNKY